MERIIIIDDSKIKAELDDFLKSRKGFVRYDNELDQFLKKTKILFEDFIQLDNKNNKIVIETEKQKYILKASSITWIEKLGDHSVLHLENGSTIQSSNPFDYLSGKLQKHLFCEISDHHLINLNYITQLNQYPEAKVEINHEQFLLVEKSKLNFIQSYLNLIQLNP